MKLKRLLGTLIVLLIALSMVIVVIGFEKAGDSKQTELWVEVTKAGLQLFVIVVLGGSVTWAFEWSRQVRDEEVAFRTEITAYRREKMRELVEITNVVRRVPLLIAGARSARTYGIQFRRLIDARAALSLLRHDIAAGGSKAFREFTEISAELQRIEVYLRLFADDYRDRYKHLSDEQKRTEDKKKSAHEMWEEIIGNANMIDLLLGAGALPRENVPEGASSQETKYARDFIAGHKRAVELIRKEML